MSVITSIDWTLLRTQKASLLDLADICTNQDQLFNIDGLLSLLDAIQDEAVATGLASVDTVFGFEIE